MILVVGGTKGGSGKTLLATTLTVLRATTGQDVLLIDADEQGSAMDFTRRRTAGEAGYRRSRRGKRMSRWQTGS